MYQLSNATREITFVFLMECISVYYFETYLGIACIGNSTSIIVIVWNIENTSQKESEVHLFSVLKKNKNSKVARRKQVQ